MGPFWTSREWEGVHPYGSVFTGMAPIRIEFLAFPLSLVN